MVTVVGALVFVETTSVSSVFVVYWFLFVVVVRAITVDVRFGCC